jgi:hypothetical protein
MLLVVVLVKARVRELVLALAVEFPLCMLEPLPFTTPLVLLRKVSFTLSKCFLALLLVNVRGNSLTLKCQLTT